MTDLQRMFWRIESRDISSWLVISKPSLEREIILYDSEGIVDGSSCFENVSRREERPQAAACLDSHWSLTSIFP